MTRTRLLATAALAVLALAVSATPAAAQAPPSLQGEQLISHFPACILPNCADAIANPPARVLQGACVPSGTSSLSFSVSGPASGPYNGTFTEQGTLSIGQQNQPPVNEVDPFTPGTFGLPSGPVLQWDATFEIDAGAYAISGSKTLTTGPIAANEHGICLDSPLGAQGTARHAYTTRLAYEATITGPEGTYTDSGISDSVIRDSFVYVPPNTVFSIAGLFREQFTLSNGVVAVEQPKPGKGCGDKNHKHARENECKKPAK